MAASKLVFVLGICIFSLFLLSPPVTPMEGATAAAAVPPPGFNNESAVSAAAGVSLMKNSCCGWCCCFPSCGAHDCCDVR